MKNISSTELRIETLHASWTRNCIILISLAIALRSFNKKNLKIIRISYIFYILLIVFYYV